MMTAVQAVLTAEPGHVSKNGPAEDPLLRQGAMLAQSRPALADRASRPSHMCRPR